MTTHNVKCVAHSNEPIENYHLFVQFPSALWRFLASFTSLVWFSLFWYTLSVLISVVSSFQPKNSKTLLYAIHSAPKQQTVKGSI